jgi:hypothetical protein
MILLEIRKPSRTIIIFFTDQNHAADFIEQLVIED